MKVASRFVFVLLVLLGSVTLTYASGIDQFTKLLIHSDTYNGDPNILNSSDYFHQVSGVSDTFHSTTQARFGNTSIYIDGDGDYLKSDDSNDWAFGSGDFTIDAWIYVTDYAGEANNGGNIAGQWADNDNRWMFCVLNDGSLRFYAMGSGASIDILGGNAIGLNVWHHVAVVRSGDEFTIYLDGFEYLSGEDTDAVPDLAADLWIGRYSHGQPDYFAGYIDELRISKGAARWTSPFTPPNAPYTPCDTADYNGDGIVDENDLTEKQKAVLESLLDWTENCWKLQYTCPPQQ